MDTNKLLRYASPLITLLLLAILAFQVARLVWHVLTPKATIQLTETQTTTQQTPWLANLQFAPQAPPTASKTVVIKANEVSKNVPVSPTATWSLKGVYAEAGDSVAIIQTPTKSYVVEAGDWVEANYRVVRITPHQVTIRDKTGEENVLALASNHLTMLAANTIGGEALMTETVARPNDILPKSLSPSNNTNNNHKKAKQAQNAQESLNWLAHIKAKPHAQNGESGLKLMATSAQGFSQLKRLGFRQGDILLSVDGQSPSPAMWQVVMKKWQQSQKIRAKIMRHGKIETITIKNTQ